MSRYCPFQGCGRPDTPVVGDDRGTVDGRFCITFHSFDFNLFHGLEAGPFVLTETKWWAR